MHLLHLKPLGRRPYGFLGQSLNDRTFYSEWPYSIRQFQSYKTVFALRRSPIVFSDAPAAAVNATQHHITCIMHLLIDGIAHLVSRKQRNSSLPSRLVATFQPFRVFLLWSAYFSLRGCVELFPAASLSQEMVFTQPLWETFAPL